MESKITKPTTAYVQQQQLKCLGVVHLKNSYMKERTGHWSVEALRTYEHLEESQHKAVSSLLSNAGSSHLLTYQQHLSAQTHTSNFTSIPQTCIPQISLQNLKGCTINFNCMPLPPTTQITNSTEEYTETELDELFSLVDM